MPQPPPDTRSYRCPRCRYDLRASLESTHCPECGWAGEKIPLCHATRLALAFGAGVLYYYIIFNTLSYRGPEAIAFERFHSPCTFIIMYLTYRGGERSVFAWIWLIIAMFFVGLQL